MIESAIEWITTVAPLQIIVWCLSAVVSLVGIIAGLIKIRTGIIEYQIKQRVLILQRSAVMSTNVADFTKDDLRDALANYITPDCAQTDPANSEDLRRFAAVREQVYGVVDRFIEDSNSRHLLVLADTGMGKTTFCLNYMDHRSRNHSKSEVSTAIIPLGRPNALEKIAKIPNPTETILILDAFDEDSLAIEDSSGRMAALMSASSAFQNVIITCRSQFFKNDNSIPSRTGVAVVRPRNRMGGEYYFETLYLLPFSEPQIRRYINSQFPLFSWNSIDRRAKARGLADNVNELSARPMLLTLIPDLIKKKRSAQELFDLYTFMIDTWMERESSWIDSAKLTAVSKRLATHIYTSRKRRQTDRVSVEELNKLAADLDVPPQEWTHLRSRSLLNRDSEGNVKFSHRSIMEYFFVIAAIEGERKCFTVFWSDFMRDIFVSWGNTSTGRASISRAKAILSMDLEKLGLSPLSEPVEGPRDYKANTYLKRSNASRRRIPKEWRGYSVKINEAAFHRTVQDNEYGLIWEIPKDDPDDDIGIQLLEVADLNTTGLIRTLSSKEQIISLIEIEETMGVDLLPRENFLWLGDRVGKGKQVVVSISAVPIPNDAAKLIGQIGVKDRHGASVWAYEPAPPTGGFGAHAPRLRAVPTKVAEVDRESRRRMHMMTPKEITDYLAELTMSPDFPLNDLLLALPPSRPKRVRPS